MSITQSETNTIDWKEKGKNATAKINATGILNKNYPDYSSNPNYRQESQAALNMLNAKYPKNNSMTISNKGGKKRRNKSKRNKSKRNKSKRNKSNKK